jgi:hypothetical protein
MQFQATLHSTPLLQSTQIMIGDPNTHFPTRIFHNAKSSGPLSYHHLHIHTSDLQQFKIYQEAIEQTNVQTLDTVQTNLLSSLWALKSKLKCHIWKNIMDESTRICRVPFCLLFSHQRRSGQTLEITRRQ